MKYPALISASTSYSETFLLFSSGYIRVWYYSNWRHEATREDPTTL